MIEKYIKVSDLLAFCENQRDHSITPNDIMRMPQADAGWISIEDRLPYPFKRVLIYSSKTNELEIGCYSEDGRMWFADDNSYGRHITHWMPLPERPREEEPNAPD